MKGNANTRPEDIIECKKKTIVNYNIKEITVTDMNGESRQAYEYDYVEVDNPLTKEKFKEALGKKDKEKKDKDPWTPDAAVVTTVSCAGERSCGAIPMLRSSSGVTLRTVSTAVPGRRCRSAHRRMRPLWAPPPPAPFPG